MCRHNTHRQTDTHTPSTHTHIQRYTHTLTTTISSSVSTIASIGRVRSPIVRSIGCIIRIIMRMIPVSSSSAPSTTCNTNYYLKQLNDMAALSTRVSIRSIQADSTRDKDQKWLVCHFSKIGYFTGYYTAFQLRMYEKSARPK